MQELQSLKVYASTPKLHGLGINAIFMSNKQCKLQQQICYFFFRNPTNSNNGLKNQQIGKDHMTCLKL